MTTLSEAKVEAVFFDQLVALRYTCINDAVSGLDGSTLEPMTKAKKIVEAVL